MDANREVWTQTGADSIQYFPRTIVRRAGSHGQNWQGQNSTQCDQNFLMDPACQETYRMGYSVVHDHGFHLRGPLLVGCAQKYYTISFKDARKKLNYFNYS